MKKKELFSLYEKLYFHEIDHREKITTRLQLPLAIFISLITILGYMIQNVDYTSSSITLIVIFLIFYLIGSFLVITGIVFFIKTFYGHTYEYLPTAKETENYNSLLKATYDSYEGGEKIAEKHFDDYLYKYFCECSSMISDINQKRSDFLHKANTLIIFSITPILISFIIFNCFNLNKCNREKIYKINIENIHDLINKINIKR